MAKIKQISYGNPVENEKVLEVKSGEMIEWQIPEITHNMTIELGVNVSREFDGEIGVADVSTEMGGIGNSDPLSVRYNDNNKNMIFVGFKSESGKMIGNDSEFVGVYSGNQTTVENNYYHGHVVAGNTGRKAVHANAAPTPSDRVYGICSIVYIDEIGQTDWFNTEQGAIRMGSDQLLDGSSNTLIGTGYISTATTFDLVDSRVRCRWASSRDDDEYIHDVIDNYNRSDSEFENDMLGESYKAERIVDVNDPSLFRTLCIYIPPHAMNMNIHSVKVTITSWNQELDFEEETTESIEDYMVSYNLYGLDENFEITPVDGTMVDYSKTPPLSTPVDEIIALAPLGLRVTSRSLSAISLTWDDSDPDVDEFIIRRSLDGINYTTIANLNRGQDFPFNEYTDNIVTTEGVKVYYSIIASIQGNSSEPSLIQIIASQYGIFNPGVPYSLEFADNNSVSVSGIIPDFEFGTGDFTCSMWVYIYAYGSKDTIIDLGRYSSGIMIRGRIDDLEIYIDGANQPINDLWDVYTQPNTWVYLVVTRISGVLKVYIDDVERLSQANTRSIDLSTSYNNLYYGRAHASGENFNGRICHTKIYNKGLTLEESIMDKYSLPNPADPNLLVHYRMDEGTGTNIADTTGNYNGVALLDTWIAG
jgi:hypothetical protein